MTALFLIFTAFVAGASALVFIHKPAWFWFLVCVCVCSLSVAHYVSNNCFGV